MNDTELLKALIAITRYCITGKTRYHSTNPYTKPEIKSALKTIAKARGIEDYFDALPKEGG